MFFRPFLDCKMTKIRTYLRCHSEKSEGYVWISFYLGTEKVSFSTKVRCDVKHWNDAKGRISIKDTFAEDKNLIIARCLARTNEVFVKYRLRNKTLTPDGFNRAYHRPDDYENFFVFTDEWKKKFAYRNSLNTMRVHSGALDKLKTFRPGLCIDEIDTEFLDEYFHHMTSKLGNCENTAYKNMGVIKKYVRAAWKAGYIDNNPFDDWAIQDSKPSYTFLMEYELQILFKMYRERVLDEKYQTTLEVFLFMCLSSLHIGDARRMMIEQFGTDSFSYFRIKTQKRKPMPIIVPISESLRSLMVNIMKERKSGPIFPKLPADQTMNRYLKDITGLAEITTKVTHKTGRHTFATFYLRKTKDLASLQEILGHSNIKETLMYAHVLDETKQEGITCFNSFKVGAI